MASDRVDMQTYQPQPTRRTIAICWVSRYLCHLSTYVQQPSKDLDTDTVVNSHRSLLEEGLGEL